MSNTVESNFCFVDKNRAILTLEGKDKIDFLQALTTNNIDNIPKEHMVYTAILSPQGKYLFDFFVFSLSNNEILLFITEYLHVVFNSPGKPSSPSFEIYS